MVDNDDSDNLVLYRILINIRMGNISMKKWVEDLDLGFLLGFAMGLLVGSTGLYLLLF